MATNESFSTIEYSQGTDESRYQRAEPVPADLAAAQQAVVGADQNTVREIAFTGNLTRRSEDPLYTLLATEDSNYEQPTRLPDQPDQRELLDRVFGNDGLRPVEPVYNRAIGAAEASYVDENDPTTFTSREYFNNPGLVGRVYQQGAGLVGPPQDPHFATVSAEAGQPIYRYNAIDDQDERQDTAIFSLEGGADDGLRDHLEQYGPPPHAGEPDILNHIRVRVPLSARYTGALDEAWKGWGHVEPRIFIQEHQVRSAQGNDELRPRSLQVDEPGNVRQSQADTSAQIEREITTINEADGMRKPAKAAAQQLQPTMTYEQVSATVA